MNKLTSISILAASALILVPKPAVAGNSELAAIGGFIGGLIVGSNVRSEPYCEPVYYPAPPVVVYSDGGYWQTTSFRVWIAPSWIVVYDRHNHPVRRHVAGHYEIRQHRTWVAQNRSHREFNRNDRDHRQSSRNNDRSDRRRNRH